MENAMRLSRLITATVLTLASTMSLNAQRPGAPPGGRPPARGQGGGGGAMAPMDGPMMGAMGGPLGNTAQFLLAHTGDLKLTDQQVVRLAAIARRADERGRSMRTSLDSM